MAFLLRSIMGTAQASVERSWPNSPFSVVPQKRWNVLDHKITNVASFMPVEGHKNFRFYHDDLLIYEWYFRICVNFSYSLILFTVDHELYYSERSLSRTPSGPALAVNIGEVSVLKRV